MNQWDFTFSYRTSVEHFSPGTEDSEHISDAYRLTDRSLLHWFGNLALVTVSANSKFSNWRCHSVEATLPVGGGLIGEVHGWREWG